MELIENTLCTLDDTLTIRMPIREALVVGTALGGFTPQQFSQASDKFTECVADHLILDFAPDDQAVHNLFRNLLEILHKKGAILT